MIDYFLSQSSFRINLYHHKALEAEYNYKDSSAMNAVFLIVGLIVIASELPIGWIFANLWISMLVSRAYYYFAFGRKKAKVDIFGDQIDIRWP